MEKEEKLDDMLLNLANSNMKLADLYYELKRYNEAIKYYLFALDNYLGIEEYSTRLNIALVYDALIKVYTELGNGEKVSEYQEKKEDLIQSDSTDPDTLLDSFLIAVSDIK